MRNSIPKIIQQTKKITDDKLNNQSSLFDSSDSNLNEFEFLPSNLWSKKELLNEEFKSLGFFISDHPLNEYDEIFNQLKIISYSEFIENENADGIVAGTIMSIQEKKSAKGSPYAIIKFSDKKGEFELFLFSEILISNRDKLKVSESFIITLQKEKNVNNNSKVRVNIRKILSLSDVINSPFTKVTIELTENCKIDEIKEILSKKGNTQINLIVNNQKQRAIYSLQNNRKFDLNQLKLLKSKESVKKITF